MPFRVNGCNTFSNNGRCQINTCKQLVKCLCASCQLVVPVSSGPKTTAPLTGSMYWDSGEGAFKVYNGSEWI